MALAVTCDAFLGGRLQITQPAQGFRAGVDAVLLAAAVPAKPGETVLDLGCGVGTASLCLGARVEGLELWGAEIDDETAELARHNATENGIKLSVYKCDLSALPAELKAQRFDHVMMNPPYFTKGSTKPMSDHRRACARHIETPLSSWIETAAKRLRPKGHLTIIQRSAMLPELLSALSHGFGGVTVLPIVPRPNRPSELCILRARRGARAPFQLLSPFVMHENGRHVADTKDYTERTESILRGAGPLIF